VPPEAFLPGYITYLVEIFVPGIGFGELMGVWGSKSILAERIGMAFGIGLAIDTIVIVFRTSGLAVGGFRFAGLETATIYLIITSGAIALLASVISRRRISFPVRPQATDYCLFLVLLALAWMVSLWFQKFPIFPAVQGPDVGIHIQGVENLIDGSIYSVPGGILAWGGYYQLASAQLLVGGEALVTVQRTMAILVDLSPLLIFFAARRLFSGQVVAPILAAVLYSFSGFLWFDMVFNTGLYSNFFGLLASMFLIGAAADLFSNLRSVRPWGIFLLALALADFSHYTTATLFPALFAVPFARLLFSRQGVVESALPGIVAFSPALILLVVNPSYASSLLSTTSLAEGNLIGQTTLSAALSPIPFLSYMAYVVDSDVAFVLILFLIATFIVVALRSRKPFLLIPLFWFLTLFVISPWNDFAWRYALEALVPVSLMVPFGLSVLLPKTQASRKRRRSEAALWKYVKLAGVLLIVLIPIAGTSWGTRMVSRSMTDTGSTALRQQEIYSTLYWLKDNTPQNSSFLSISAWQFTFSNVMFGRESQFLFTNNQTIATRAVDVLNDSYLIAVNPFKPTSGFQAVYNTSDITVYRVR